MVRQSTISVLLDAKAANVRRVNLLNETSDLAHCSRAPLGSSCSRKALWEPVRLRIVLTHNCRTVQESFFCDTLIQLCCTEPPLRPELHVLISPAFRMAVGTVVAVTGATGKQGAVKDCNTWTASDYT